MTIKKATEKEVLVILELLRALYSELGEEKESIAFLSGNLIKSILQSGSTGIYLVEENSACIGIFTLTESQAIYAGGKYGSLDEMYVIPAYRNKQMGTAMIERILQIASKKNWTRIDVTAPTEEKWVRTRKFYERNGFVFTGPKFKLKLT